jgi:serine/threonine protein phosphatase PrpC
MAFEIDIGFVSDRGQKAVNEDFCGAMLPEAGLEGMGAIAAIADGVSQGGMGREAAQTTVVSVLRDYYGTPQTWNTTVALERLITTQNTWLAGINRRRAPSLGLCTLTTLVLRGQSYFLAHVGDSRAYLYRDKQLLQLTNDHVVNHPDFQHQLLRSVGSEDQIVVDCSQGDLQRGDVFILLTDGVHGSINEASIALLIEQNSEPQATAHSLKTAALKAGSQDNLSALVIRVNDLLDPTFSDEQQAMLSLPIPARLKVGQLIDGLQVMASVADNGVNLVYQVQDLASHKLFALKTLNPSRALDPEERAMLAHEAWLARRIGTSAAADYFVRLHDQLPNGNAFTNAYLLYDWHSGETVSMWLAEKGPLQVAQLLNVATQAIRGLMHLHRQGVVHRDINPSNLHHGEDGVLRILDLGVALSGREPLATRELHAGTPSYVNPEQWGYSASMGTNTEQIQNHQLPDYRSDLFALGVTLYQILTGKLPYGEILPNQIGRYYRDPTPPSRFRPDIPIWLDRVLLKAVARDQALRFETGEEFLLALERGAARPLLPINETPLFERNPTLVWKLGMAISLLFNMLFIFWLLFLPTGH